jgi:hypothetical protein
MCPSYTSTYPTTIDGLHFSSIDAQDASAVPWLLTITPSSYIRVSENLQSQNYMIFRVTGSVVPYQSPPFSPTIYYQVPVVYISGNNTASIIQNDFITVSYSETGATGYTGVTGPTGLGAGNGAGVYNFYFDLESGADLLSSGPGPGFIISNPTIDSVNTVCAIIYPNNVYFNENAGTTTSWSNGYPVGTNNTWNSSVPTPIFFKIPLNGVITSISVNELTWFTNTNGIIDIILANGTTYRSVGVGLPALSGISPTFPITAYSTTFTNSTNILAGEGLTCVIKQEVSAWSLPFSPISGLINVTVYVKFT